jgi:Stigma-specific protein, Stig1
MIRRASYFLLIGTLSVAGCGNGTGAPNHQSSDACQPNQVSCSCSSLDTSTIQTLADESGGQTNYLVYIYNANPPDTINGECVQAVPPDGDLSYFSSNSYCTDLTSDFFSCGQCGFVCTGTYPVCVNSTCTDLETDASNCGAVGKACGADQFCCKAQCINVYTDPKNCGSCGYTCSGAQPACVESSGGQPTCTDLSTDFNNCGAVGNVCQSGQDCCMSSCQTLAPSGAPCTTSQDCCSGTCDGNSHTCA